MTETAKVLKRVGNVAVVHLDQRRFPAICMQGDSFFNLVGEIEAALIDDDKEERDALRAKLRDLVQIYEETLHREGLELPYLKP